MPSAFTIEFEPLASLPPLSWCARVRGGGGVTVRHGVDVETRGDGFVEGVWDGQFEAFEFDNAQSLSGTGGRLRNGVLVFAAPFHPLERLFVLRGPDETLVSNSLVFLLSEAGDKLDIRYPNYFFDLVGQVRRGITPPVTRLRTAAGRAVELFPCCNLEVHPDLTLRRTPKPLGAPPSDYADYFELLLRTVERFAANGAAPERKKAYPLLASCSRGYDSTAVAALASRAGCREGVTFTQSGFRVRHPLLGTRKEMADDSGADSLRLLGMEVTEYGRTDVLSLPGHPKAEFYFRPASCTDVSMRVMEDKLHGTVYLSGRHGERYWNLSSRCSRRDFREIDDCNLSGHAFGEFRLRVGFVHFPVPYVGALHGPAIFRITHSEEMRPWKLGTGIYDRPIARRIAEESGIPREYFGQQKRGACEAVFALSDESEQDFQEFLRSEVPEKVRRRLDPRPLVERLKPHYGLDYVRTQYSHFPLVSPLMDVLQTDRLNKLWNSLYLYEFHWGFEKIKSRYSESET